MDDLLLVRTFTLLGGMLIITTIFSRINKAYETTTEAVITVFGVFLFFFLSLFYANQCLIKYLDRGTHYPIKSN